MQLIWENSENLLTEMKCIFIIKSKTTVCDYGFPSVFFVAKCKRFIFMCKTFWNLKGE
jgi:hypothetical protein